MAKTLKKKYRKEKYTFFFKGINNIFEQKIDMFILG